MAKHPPREVLPGNDGRWYLELVGVVEPELESTDTYATLQALVPPATPDGTATVSSGATAAAVNGALVPDAQPSGEFVALAPDAATGSETVRPSWRGRRWWRLGLALVLVAAPASAAAEPPKQRPRTPPPSTRPLLSPSEPSCPRHSRHSPISPTRPPTPTRCPACRWLSPDSMRRAGDRSAWPRSHCRRPCHSSLEVASSGLKRRATR